MSSATRAAAGTAAAATLLAVLAAVVVSVFPSALGRAIVAVAPSGDPSVTSGLLSGELPQTSTITDVRGTPIAWFYDQRRTSVNRDQISDTMVDALVAIEDRRFFDHAGVDGRGIVRAGLGNLANGEITAGASTIEQQWVKNYRLIRGDDSADDRSYTRKLVEAAMAVQVSSTKSKDEIITGYLNTVYFGNGAYGIEEAARTYFGIPAAELDLVQSSLLAGLVQQPTALDPYAHPDDARHRRRAVLDAMADTGAITAAERDAAAAAGLGVGEAPRIRPTGCAAAGRLGHFCDLVRSWLTSHGIDDLTTGGYTVTTTLDPDVQSSLDDALINVGGDPAGAAEIATVIAPGADSRRVLAAGSTRPYGLGEGKTTQPLTYEPTGHGAGSIFKIFAAAAGVDDGLSPSAVLPVPASVVARGIGDGGGAGCPAGAWCVSNAGQYPPSMTLREALATSPNTPFVTLVESSGVKPVVDMAVRLGLRSYDSDGTAAAAIEANQGSFVLGTEPVSSLELTNVGATLASGGMWCEPDPIDAITAPGGEAVDVNVTPCQRAVDAGVADTLADALSDDAVSGTAADAAAAQGWHGGVSGKTGTTDSSMSAAFLGFTGGFSASVMAVNDGSEPAPLCSAPLRQCSAGGLFGGQTPAQTWFAAMNPIADSIPGGRQVANSGGRFVAASDDLAAVIGMDGDKAKEYLVERGWSKVSVARGFDPGAREGTVVRVRGEVALRSSPITLIIQDPEQRPEPQPSSERPPQPTQPAAPSPNPPKPRECPTVTIPFIGPVPVC